MDEKKIIIASILGILPFTGGVKNSGSNFTRYY